MFELNIYPKDLSSSEATEIFASTATLLNDRALYFLTATIVDSFGNQIEVFDDAPYEDNLSCLDGDVGPGAKAYEPLSNLTSTIGQEQGISCASVKDVRHTGKQGLMSFILGLILAISFFVLCRRKNDFFV